MSDALRELIDGTAWIDTHEHLLEERNRLRDDAYEFSDGIGNAHCLPGDWTSLIANYALDDLVCAGLPIAAAQELLRSTQEPLEKWRTVEPYVEAARATGYLRAVDLSTERLFGSRLSGQTVEELDRALRDLRREGYYAHVLRDVANVERCHVHSLEQDPFCETATPDILEQDLAIVPLALGTVGEAATLDAYLELVEQSFAQYGPKAVAVKCHWAYLRTLAVADVAEPPRREFERLRHGEATADEQRLVEDFLFRRCIDHATAYELPVKVHLGYLAWTGNPRLPWTFDHVRDIAGVVNASPRTQFVLMHVAWPQQEQLLAVAKHHANVFVDLCWSWIVSPHATSEFVQRFLTTVPANKLLCFGGDYLAVENVVGHAEIARRGLRHSLEELVRSGWLTVDEALALVQPLMRGNAERLFY